MQQRPRISERLANRRLGTGFQLWPGLLLVLVTIVACGVALNYYRLKYGQSWKESMPSYESPEARTKRAIQELNASQEKARQGR